MFDGPERCKQGMAGRETARALLPRARRLVLMRTEGCQERAWRKAESGGRGEEGESESESERERESMCLCVCVSVCLCVCVSSKASSSSSSSSHPFSFFASLLFPVLRFVPCIVPPHSSSLFLSRSFSLSSLAPQSCAYLATRIAALLSLVLVP